MGAGGGSREARTDTLDQLGAQESPNGQASGHTRTSKTSVLQGII